MPPNADQARRRVVTAFVARAGRVLLLRRSAKVSSFAGKWAGVSGAVEEGELPEQTVWRELAEETGWTRGELSLVRAGLYVDATGKVGKREQSFRVHPFLFALSKGAADPRLDWEHDEARWAEPDEVITLSAVAETVPELDEALARVWDPPAALPRPYREEARAIFDDRTSGSAELARRAASLVLEGAPAERVAGLRPTMAALVNAARAAGRRGLQIHDELEAATAVAAAAARKHLVAGRTVATFSRSSTVLAALAGAPSVRLLVGVSEPGGEGRLTAETAREHGHEVVLVDDDELRQRVQAGEASLVLLGADAVTRRGDVVNKVGTTALSEAAAAARPPVPVVVVADAWKRWDDDVPPPLEPHFEVVPAVRIGRLDGVA